MFQFSKEQMAMFGEGVFKRNLTNALNDEYPTYMRFFSSHQKEGAVKHMLQRARHFGIHRQSGLSLFARLSLAVAPNFYEQSDIKAFLTQGPGTPNDRILSLVDNISDPCWEEARSHKSVLPLYTSFEGRNLSLRERVCEALNFLYGDRYKPDILENFVDKGMKLSENLFPAHMEDAPYILARCYMVYGDDFPDHKTYPRLKDIFTSPPRPPQIILNLLRLRLILDTARRACDV